MAEWLALSDQRRLVGDSHPRAKYTNREVDLVHELKEGGMRGAQVARVMEMPRSTVYSILSGSRRAAPAFFFKKVAVNEKKG